ncbi:hypothetical protein MAH1_24220 [Sessilibacter sp. MAH1]
MKKIILITSILFSVSACSSEVLDQSVTQNNTTATTSSTNAQIETCTTTATIFNCNSNSDRYYLCISSDVGYIFTNLNGNQSKILFTTDQKSDFEFSNYHRFKVNQNSLSFSSKYKKFELFDYYDEESQPPESEIGIVISDLKGNIEEEISCEADSVSNLVEFE